MRWAVTSGSLWPRPTAESLTELSAVGVTELELTLQASEFYQTYFGDFRFSLADQLRELVSQARLRVNSMHAPHLSPEHAHSTRARLAYLRRCLDLGADLGCRFLVVHPFHLFVSYEHAQHYLTGGLPVWDALLPGFSDVLHAAEAGGQIIALENIAVWESDATGFFNTPANVGRLLADVDSPHLAMTLDVVHAQSAHNLPPFLDELRDSIVTAHVADLARPQRRVPPGAGEIDWPALLKALAGLPRLHHAVLELAHGTPAGVRDSLDFLRPP